MADNEHLCVHARFRRLACRIWNHVEQSDDEVARETAIEESCNCPPGRLVIQENVSGKTIEPEFNKSIVVIEYPPRGEHGPLWVRGGIPIESSDGKPYEIQNRVTLFRCGISESKPFLTAAIFKDKNGQDGKMCVQKELDMSAHLTEDPSVVQRIGLSTKLFA